MDFALRSSDVIYTDVWFSMGEESQVEERIQLLQPYQVNREMMAKTGSDQTIFMHCLPAHREEEVSAALLEDNSISVVWDEAENRLHAQKALMVFLLSAST